MNTVLIVDNDKRCRQNHKSILQKSGIPIQIIMECSNGQTALEILKEQRIDVILMAVRMPKVDGIQLAKEVSLLPSKPFMVAISSSDDFSAAVELMGYGVREYLLKPVDQQKLLQVMEKLEHELEENRESDYEIINLGYQQLKYLITDQNMKKRDVDILIHQYKDRFYFQEYVVCCTDNRNQDCQSSNYIYLGEIEENELYIVGLQAREFLFKNELKNRLTGVSRPHKGIEELPKAYREAKQARKQAFCHETSLVFYEEMVQEMLAGTDQNQNTNIEPEAMAQIAQMIGTDKIEEGLKRLSHIISSTRRGQYTADSFASSARILMDTIKNTYQNVLDMNQDELTPFYRIFQYHSLQQYEKSLIQWLRTFHERINSEFDDYKNKQKIQQATQYIQENYNKDLNMAVVSNFVSMNYSLFSYTFKQYTGSNFVNYLKEIRINEAKRLLAETDQMVAEVGQSIGYENEKHFMKTFKSVCGVSPTEYRKNMRYNRELR